MITRSRNENEADIQKTNIGYSMIHERKPAQAALLIHLQAESCPGSWRRQILSRKGSRFLVRCVSIPLQHGQTDSMPGSLPPDGNDNHLWGIAIACYLGEYAVARNIHA